MRRNTTSAKFKREDEFKEMYKAWQNNRRVEILYDFADRCDYNMKLQQISGQPCIAQARREGDPNCPPQKFTRPQVTAHLDQLAKPRQDFVPKDYTMRGEYRKLHYIDDTQALETVQPGALFVFLLFCFLLF